MKSPGSGSFRRADNFFPASLNSSSFALSSFCSLGVSSRSVWFFMMCSFARRAFVSDGSERLRVCLLDYC